MKRILSMASLALLFSRTLSAQAPQPFDNTPVAPIAVVEFRGFTNAIRLGNTDMNVVVVPSIGRIAQITFAGMDNILRADTGLMQQVAVGSTPGGWRNFGGDWLWPVPQVQWTKHFGRDWPPPVLFDAQPWTGTAWVNADGSRACLLELEVGEPLNVRVSRRIVLDAQQPRLIIRQRIERTAESPIPVSLWNITQISDVEAVALPVDTHSLLRSDFITLGFAPVPDELVSTCESSVVIHVQGGSEHKIGSVSPRGWIGAKKGQILVLQHAASRDGNGEFPDDGCRVEMYTNKGMKYTEIETLSEAVILPAGASLENLLQIACYSMPSSQVPCDVATFIRQRLGEVMPETAPAP